MLYKTHTSTPPTPPHNQEHVQRLHRYENIPMAHSDARYKLNAMSSSHSLAVVVHPCEGHTTEEQLYRALREIDSDKAGYRVPLLVLAKDAAEATALRARLHVQHKAGKQHWDSQGVDDVLTMNINGIPPHSPSSLNARQPDDEFRLARLFGMAIVAPAAGAHLSPSASCGDPPVAAVRAAVQAALTAFNVTHLLFTDVPRYMEEFLAPTYGNLQHVHGHYDRLRVFTEGSSRVLCAQQGGTDHHAAHDAMDARHQPPHDAHNSAGLWERSGHSKHRVLEAHGQGCGAAVGFLVGVRGPHTALLKASQDNATLSDVCVQGLPSQACVYGWARHQ